MTQRKWRDDGQCGKYYPLPDGTPSECDPHGDFPCCNGVKCGNRRLDCNCWGCVDYSVTKIKKWREDRRCGNEYPLPDGKPAQCDPDGTYNLCCNVHVNGERGNWCIDPAHHEYCSNYHSIVDYSANKKWRDNGRCGVRDYPLPDGRPSECDPYGEYPCCRYSWKSRCGNTSGDCICKDCIDYRLIVKWRKNKMCENATAYPLWDDTQTDSNGNLESYQGSSEDAKLKKQINYEDNVFKCGNGRCVNYKQLCNRIDDCGDLSDELDCPQHMICERTINSTNPQIIHVKDACDGKVDCFDWSDECNDSCGREILGSRMLKIICCLMAIFAMVFNSVSLTHGISSIIHNCPTEKSLITKVLMSLIGSGDFLMGVYLIVLFIYDSLVYGSSYCQHQPEWLTGTPCMALGIISTVGSQLSLFSMTTLSCIIMYGVVFKNMRISGPVTRKSILKATSLALTIVAASLIIAATPLFPFFEDYFVHFIYYGSDIGILSGLVTKQDHFDIFSRQDEFDHKGLMRSIRSKTWSDIRNKMDYLYMRFGDILRYPVHFYGNDGVCLFKYFHRQDVENFDQFDIKLNKQFRTTHEVAVPTMLVLNSVCFVIITVCYIAITWKTKKSTQESGQSDNPERLKENRAIQNRIILIIVTDFLCWVPFIIISGLHNQWKIDASTWYKPLAMTVLPLNSVINPLLYDKILFEFIKKKLGQPWEFATSGLRNFSFRSAIPALFRRSNE